jgi:hypothetical protein
MDRVPVAPPSTFSRSTPDPWLIIYPWPLSNAVTCPSASIHTFPSSSHWTSSSYHEWLQSGTWTSRKLRPGSRLRRLKKPVVLLELGAAAPVVVANALGVIWICAFIEEVSSFSPPRLLTGMGRPVAVARRRRRPLSMDDFVLSPTRTNQP